MREESTARDLEARVRMISKTADPADEARAAAEHLCEKRG
jgi:hypothetical protein